MQPLLVEELCDQCVDHGTWRLDRDALASRFDPVAFYRALYQTGQLGVEAYGPDNVGELSDLMTVITSEPWDRPLRDAGLLLTHEDRIDLTERLVRAITTAVVLHVPEPETFRAMLHDARRFDEALRLYCDTFLPEDAVQKRCVCDYLGVRGVEHDVRRAAALGSTAAAYLRQLFIRHVVDLRSLAAALMEILQTVARHEGYLRAPRIDDEQSGTRPNGHPRGASLADRRDAALRVLGLHGRADHRVDPRSVRDAYRRLMRRYHPDVNPNGLEMAKRITNAYAEVLGSLA